MNEKSDDVVLFQPNESVRDIRKKVNDLVPVVQRQALDTARMTLFASRGCTVGEFYLELSRLLKESMESTRIVLKFKKARLQIQRLVEEEVYENSIIDLCTLFDRITFKYGILCKFNFTCCEICAVAAIDKELKMINIDEQKVSKFSGYTFFTQRDTRMALEGVDSSKYGEELLSVWMSFSCVRTANVVIRTLREADISVHWNNNINTRLHAFVPRKRFHGQIQCACNNGALGKCKDCYGSGVMRF